jgi:LmbE family N-acetylglucosaminyl deacetylase
MPGEMGPGAPDAALQDAAPHDADGETGPSAPPDGAVQDAAVPSDAGEDVNDASLPTERVFNMVAHPDDDLGLMNPDLLFAIERGARVQTVIMTAGNAAFACLDYAAGREAGMKEAYALMAGRENRWSESTLRIAGHSMRRVTLEDSEISLVFLGLSDDLSYQLRRLWQGDDERISTWPDARRPAETYTRDELVSVLLELLRAFDPTQVHTNDASLLYPQFFPFDHPDHAHAGLFSLLALEAYEKHPPLRMYRAYNIQFDPANVPSETAERTWHVFETYFAHDAKVCSGLATTICDTPTECNDPNLFYVSMKARQYSIGMVRGSSTLQGPLATCLERSAGAVVAGTCPGASVLWRLESDDTVRDIAGEQCISAPLDPAGTLRMAPCIGSPNQRFRVTERGQLRGPGARCAQVSGDKLTLAACADVKAQLGFVLGP